MIGNRNVDAGLMETMQNVADGSQILPAECYTDANYLNAELDRIFKNGWMGVAFASDVPDVGDILPCTVFGQPLLITRDGGAQIHVFANVCRHRGHVLVNKPCQGKKALSCPYHSWSYGLDGRFLHAPYWNGVSNSRPDPEQQEKMGLLPIPFAIWYDMILINLDHSAGPFEEYIVPLNGRWQTAQPESALQRFSSSEYTISGNWKLAAENFLDNYHLPWVHPEIGSSMEASIGLEVENIRLSPDIIGFSHPRAGEDKSKADKPLPCWQNTGPEIQMRQDLFFVFPNICLVMEGNYLWSMLLLPDGAERCYEKIALYVVSDEAMEEQYAHSREQLAQIIYRINDQDASAIQQLQKGRNSFAASQGVFDEFHDKLGRWFHRQVARKLL